MQVKRLSRFLIALEYFVIGFSKLGRNVELLLLLFRLFSIVSESDDFSDFSDIELLLLLDDFIATVSLKRIVLPGRLSLSFSSGNFNFSSFLLASFSFSVGSQANGANPKCSGTSDSSESEKDKELELLDISIARIFVRFFVIFLYDWFNL